MAVALAWSVEPQATRDQPGTLRTGGVRIRAVQVPLPTLVPVELDAWSRSSAALGARHPIIHAAEHHAWFERIHPFVDGNGRAGRLVLNFMLLQHGYPPAVILATQRRRYLKALEQADAGNPNPLAEVIARAVHDTLNRFLIPNLAGAAKLVPLSALAAGTSYSPAYLRSRVLSGRLRAVRNGKLWLSSRAWLDEYVRSRDRRGSKDPEREIRKQIAAARSGSSRRSTRSRRTLSAAGDWAHTKAEASARPGSSGRSDHGQLGSTVEPG